MSSISDHQAWPDYRVLFLAVTAAWSLAAIANEASLSNDIEPSPAGEFVTIAPGCFWMGSPETEHGRDQDELRHRVCITKPYAMGRYEVTQNQWRAVMGATPSYFRACGGRCPVERVSWTDTQAFIAKLNTMTGANYRLPSEAEWEYAARAGTDTPFSFGDDIDSSQVNYNGRYPYRGEQVEAYQRAPMAVGSYPVNPWGLHDMHGNVWEWVQDYQGPYPADEVQDPNGPSSGANRVYRGGSWSSTARRCRSAARNLQSPGRRYFNLGFRLSRTLETEQ
jgi:formylglycine-generating enzyme required for sulfatase activity